MHKIPLVGLKIYHRVHPSSCTSAVGSYFSLWSWSQYHVRPIIREVHNEYQWLPPGDGIGQHFKLVDLIIKFIKDISKQKVYFEAYFKLCILPLQ